MIQDQSSLVHTQVSWPDSGKNPGGEGRTAVRLRNAVYYGLVVAIYVRLRSYFSDISFWQFTR